MSESGNSIINHGDRISVQVDLFLYEEGEYVVVFCPALDLASQGYSEDEALNNFDELLDIFIEDIVENNTLNIVLEELGWKKVTKPNVSYIPPVQSRTDIPFQLLKQDHKQVRLPA